MISLEFFTPEQKSSIPSYKQKWLEIALSTEPINQEKASAAVKAAYNSVGKRKPKIEFCSSPQDALFKIDSSIPTEQTKTIPFREITWKKWLLVVAK